MIAYCPNGYQIVFVHCAATDNFHSREKLVQFKEEATEEKASTLGKLSNDNSKEVELSNEGSKDKSAAAC